MAIIYGKGSVTAEDLYPLERAPVKDYINCSWVPLVL